MRVLNAVHFVKKNFLSLSLCSHLCPVFHVDIHHMPGKVTLPLETLLACFDLAGKGPKILVDGPDVSLQAK